MSDRLVRVRVCKALRREYVMRGVFPEFVTAVPQGLDVGAYEVAISEVRAHAVFVDGRDQYLHRRFTLEDRAAKTGYLRMTRALGRSSAWKRRRPSGRSRAVCLGRSRAAPNAAAVERLRP